MPKKQITIPVFIPNLGCPNLCVFCNQKHSTGIKTVPDADFVRTQISRYISSVNPSVTRIEIAFFGGNFTGIPQSLQSELLSVAHEFKKKGVIKSIRLSTRPDYIDDNALGLLSEYEVETIELGVQSFSDRVLAASQRGHTSADTLRAIGLIEERKFLCIIQLMTGLPEDSREESVRSAQTASSLQPDGVRIYPVIVLKNTELDRMYGEGLYSPLSLEDAVETCAEMYMIFESSGIPVIRMGIHPLSPEDMENIVAGPYHPSFGFFVKSRVRRGQMEKMILEHIERSRKTSSQVSIPVLNREEYIGYKRENIRYLKNRFGDILIDYVFSDSAELTIY
jgi:histone acetyltransferase (RNA polymerase elongator complex component)